MPSFRAPPHSPPPVCLSISMFVDKRAHHIIHVGVEVGSQGANRFHVGLHHGGERQTGGLVSKRQSCRLFQPTF